MYIKNKYTTYVYIIVLLFYISMPGIKPFLNVRKSQISIQ